MKQFFITNPVFTGSAKITYDFDGKLVQIDLLETNMTHEQVAYFKVRVPTLESDLQQAFSNNLSTVIVEKGIEISFDQFWNNYGIKINRKRCEALWQKLTSEERVLAYVGIKKYNKFLRDLKYNRAKSDPDTYLRNRYWENEY